MNVSRRIFLKSGGVAMIGMSTIPAFLQRAVAATPMPNKKKLIVLFQRGAADGLNIVVPFGEKNYYKIRPTIAIPQPRQGDESAAVDLDGFFGLHPSLAPLGPLFHQGQLAIVHAAGSPDTTRSHFDAQDYMESGTPGVKSTEDGWLNRTVQEPQEEDNLRSARWPWAESSAHAARRRSGDRAGRRKTISRHEPIRRRAGRL